LVGCAVCCSSEEGGTLVGCRCAQMRPYLACASAAVANVFDEFIIEPLVGAFALTKRMDRIISAEEYLNRMGMNDMSATDEKKDIPAELFTKQMFDWDCGLACVVMAVKFSDYHKSCRTTGIQRSELLIPLFQEYLRLATPLWTIDIFCLLGAIYNGTELELCTQCVGISADAHKDIEWYTNYDAGEDHERVMKKFDEAKVSPRV
jgi:hypothetical protein